MTRKLSALIAASAFGALMVPGVALADTAVIGSALTLPYEGGVSTGDTTTLQQTQAGGLAPNPLTSPADGVITGWKVRTSDDGAIYTLRILSPTATVNSYVASGSVTAPAVPPGTDDTILSYPGNNVPIKKGDHIGVLQTGDSEEGIIQNTTDGIATNVIANLFTGDPVNGVPTAFIPDQQHELLLQATVEFTPDGGPAKKKKKCKKKKKKGKGKAGAAAKKKKCKKKKKKK